MVKRALRRELSRALAEEAAALIRRFHEQTPAEHPYAFAFVAPPEGHHVMCAVATEEGLIRTADRYLSEGWHDPNQDSLTTLRTWLRWVNPDDGWHYLDVSPELRARWSDCYYPGPFALFDGSAERICTVALILLRRSNVFATFAPPAIASFTYGQSSDDYVRFARRTNPPPAFAILSAEDEASLAASRRVRSARKSGR